MVTDRRTREDDLVGTIRRFRILVAILTALITSGGVGPGLPVAKGQETTLRHNPSSEQDLRRPVVASSWASKRDFGLDFLGCEITLRPWRWKMSIGYGKAQAPADRQAATQATLSIEEPEEGEAEEALALPKAKLPWPKTLPEQAQAI
jgi:hypothetical protein